MNEDDPDFEASALRMEEAIARGFIVVTSSQSNAISTYFAQRAACVSTLSLGGLSDQEIACLLRISDHEAGVLSRVAVWPGCQKHTYCRGHVHCSPWWRRWAWSIGYFLRLVD